MLLPRCHEVTRRKLCIYWNVLCIITYILIKGLRPVLERFVVIMHEGGCKTESEADADRPRDLAYCTCKPECIVTTTPDRSILITIITWHFQFPLVNCSILHLRYEYGSPSKRRFTCYSPCYVTWCPFTTGIVASQCPVGTGRCACDALPHTFNIGVFKTVNKNSTTIKHGHN